jgi:alpha-aminoadipate carrier protein LysW
MDKEALLMAACVECEAEFDIEEPELGDLVSCPECGLDMEIITIKPLELEAVAEEEEEEEEPEEEDDWNE